MLNLIEGSSSTALVKFVFLNYAYFGLFPLICLSFYLRDSCLFRFSGKLKENDNVKSFIVITIEKC